MASIRIDVDSPIGDIEVSVAGPPDEIGGDPRKAIEEVMKDGMEKLCRAYKIDPHDLLLRWQHDLLTRKEI